MTPIFPPRKAGALYRLDRKDLLCVLFAAGWQALCAYLWTVPARMLIGAHSARETLWFEPGGLYVLEALRLDHEHLSNLALPWAIGWIALAVGSLPARFILLRRAAERTHHVASLSLGRFFLHQSVLAALAFAGGLLVLIATFAVRRPHQDQVGDLSLLIALPLGLGALLWLLFCSFSDRSQCELTLGHPLREALGRAASGPRFWLETGARLVKGMMSLTLGGIALACIFSAPLLSDFAEKLALEAALGLGLLVDLVWFSWLALARGSTCDKAERSGALVDPS